MPFSDCIPCPFTFGPLAQWQSTKNTVFVPGLTPWAAEVRLSTCNRACVGSTPTRATVGLNDIGYLWDEIRCQCTCPITNQ